MPNEPSAGYDLRAPQSETEWAEYHAIRRHVLFELRGRVHEYDARHPDESREGNFPLLLFLGADIVGVVRIDVRPPVAALRRVAIRPERQRQGHGTALLALSERFAGMHGCSELISQVALDAVTFYKRRGFEIVQPSCGSVLAMRKDVSLDI